MVDEGKVPVKAKRVKLTSSSKKVERWTTIYVPKALHKRLASIVLEQSVRTGKKVRIWEYLTGKLKNEKAD